MKQHMVHTSTKVLAQVRACTLTHADAVKGYDGGWSKKEWWTCSAVAGVSGEPLDSSGVKRVMMGEGRVRKE